MKREKLKVCEKSVVYSEVICENDQKVAQTRSEMWKMIRTSL